MAERSARQLHPRRGTSVVTATFLCALAGAAHAEEALFREVAAAWGLDFRHHHGGSGRYYQVETDGSGVAILDFDVDGDLDVFFVDSGSLPGYEGEPPRSRLFRNEGENRFIDVTARSGVDVTSYGMGTVAGDIEGDGDLDLYVTGFGRNELFLNAGDGTFAKASSAAGADEPRWSASAAFGDADRDGDLDLYVANYLVYSLPDKSDGCPAGEGRRSYCHPALLEAEPDTFYRNDGMGRFEDATREANLEREPGKGLGAVFRDFDGNGWPDLYVANDTTANFLFLNRGDGTFSDESLLSGTAYNEQTLPEAGMGIAVGDVTADENLDIFVTNYSLETNALYGSLGGGLFSDARFIAGVAEASIPMLGFGTEFGDFDLDGDLDLLVANGHVLDEIEAIHPGLTYRQRNQLFVQEPGGRFRESKTSGLDVARVSRGLATGDLDGDGDLDAVVSNSNDVAEVYDNSILPGSPAGWLELDLVSGTANTSAIGARVTLGTAGSRQIREVAAGSSYLSHSALTLHFGVDGKEESPRPELEVAWPGGGRHRYFPPLTRRLRLYDRAARSAREQPSHP